MVYLDAKSRRQLVTCVQQYCVLEAFADKPFTFASGEQGFLKFDLDAIWRNSTLANLVGCSVAQWIKQHAPETTLVGGPDSAGILFANYVLPHLPEGACTWFRVPKIHGSRALDTHTVLSGVPLRNDGTDFAVIVDDVANKGTNGRGTWQALQNHGVNVLHEIVVLDREEGAKDVMERLGVEQHSLLVRSEIGR